MTNKETVNRNIGLSFDLIRQVIESPAMLKKLDDDSVIEFLQKDYPNREIMGQVVPDTFIKVKRNFELIQK